MNFFKQIFLVVVAVGAFSNAAVACGDYGCNSWDGMVEVGLYGWGEQMFNTFSGFNESSSSYNCGLITPCSGGYESAGMYGNNFGFGSECCSDNININIFNLVDLSNTASNPYVDTYDIGCPIGNCKPGSYMPYNDYNMPSMFPGANSPIGYSPYDPSYPPSIYGGNSPFDFPYTNQPGFGGSPFVEPPSYGYVPYGYGNPGGYPGTIGPGIGSNPRGPYVVPRDPFQPPPQIPTVPGYTGYNPYGGPGYTGHDPFGGPGVVSGRPIGGTPVIYPNSGPVPRDPFQIPRAPGSPFGLPTDGTSPGSATVPVIAPGTGSSPRQPIIVPRG